MHITPIEIPAMSPALKNSVKVELFELSQVKSVNCLALIYGLYVTYGILHHKIDEQSSPLDLLLQYQLSWHSKRLCSRPALAHEFQKQNLDF